jgi:DNA topoisomerase IB
MIFKRTCLIMEYLDICVQSYIGNIRAAYTKGFTSKDITKQQIAVATYFIDKLALRAGNEKVQI